jgi:hypothetical protein
MIEDIHPLDGARLVTRINGIPSIVDQKKQNKKLSMSAAQSFSGMIYLSCPALPHRMVVGTLSLARPRGLS